MGNRSKMVGNAPVRCSRRITQGTGSANPRATSIVSAAAIRMETIAKR
jgi:hypothetical protein